MPDWIKPAIENLGRLLVAFFSFVAGKQAKELQDKKAVLDDIKKAGDIANNINAGSADDIKRLRNKWTR